MRSSRVLVFLLVGLAVGIGCRPAPRPSPEPTGPAKGPPILPSPTLPKPAAPEPIRVEVMDSSEIPPSFVLRGARGNHLMVFLHGLCGHGQGYAQSFQFAAARFGPVVAPQGDVLCGRGPFSTWSGDLVRIDVRVMRAFAALGVPEPSDVTMIGYSLGATLAEGLARRWPGRYTRLVLIAAPSTPSPHGMKQLRSTVMMSGSRDRKDLMRAGVGAMRRAGIPSTFMELPGASHGEMGPEAERVMGEALAWLFEHEVGSASSAAAPGSATPRAPWPP